MTATIRRQDIMPSDSKLSGMGAVTLKGLWANKSRFGLSSLAVIISVAFLTAMLILSDAIAGTASEDVAVANAGVDVIILGEELGLGDGPPGAESIFRATIDPAVLDSVLAVDGVDNAVGIRSATAQLLDAEGKLIVSANNESVGQTWVADEELSTFKLVDGTAPTDGVVIDQSTADEADLAVGDSVQVLTEVGIADVLIEGIATYGTADNQPETSTVLFADTTALLGTGGFDRIVVDTGLDNDLDTPALTEAAGVNDVQSGAAYVADIQNTIDAQNSFLSTFLLAFALIALIAGTTIIYNTFVIAVAQRTRELALLRSIGASRTQVLKAVMGEAAVIGVVASVAGAIVGIGTAYGMLEVFDLLGLPILAGSLPLTTSPLVIGAVVGLVVTLISAFVPARKAANTPPIAALRDAAVDPSGVSRTRNGAAIVLLGGGLALAVLGALDGSWEIAVAGVAAFFVGIIVGGPLVSGWVARIGGTPLEWAGGAVGRLASTNAARNPRRSASTALALTLGVTLMSFFTVVASSLSGTAAADTERALSADQVVTPFAVLGGPDDITYLPPSVADSIETSNGVEAVVPVASTTIFADGTMALAAGTNTAEFGNVYDLDVTSGSLADVNGTAIAVHADIAEGSALGDTVTVTFPQSGEMVLSIAAIYETNLPGQFPAQYLFDETEFAAVAPDAGDAVVFISTDGSDTAATALATAIDAAGGAELLTADDYIDSLGGAVDAFRNFVYALLGVAVIIAIVGIANTTVMAIGERTKEIGMLRAVGMTAGQVRRMIRNEALLLSLQGSVVGLSLGIGGVWAVFTALGDDQIALSLPVTALAIIGIGGAVSGVLAAAWPAWRASAMAPLDAIA